MSHGCTVDPVLLATLCHQYCIVGHHLDVGQHILLTYIEWVLPSAGGSVPNLAHSSGTTHPLLDPLWD